VGAAIAAGSHDLNGTWALLVIAATIYINVRQSLLNVSAFIDIIHSPLERVHDKEIIIKMSPIRLVMTVNIPAARDFLF